MDIDLLGRFMALIEDEPDNEPWDAEWFCMEVFPECTDVDEYCLTALVDRSISHAVKVAQYLLPGRTIDIVIYDKFTGCRINIPGRPACCYMAKHVFSSHAVLLAAFSYVRGENGQA